MPRPDPLASLRSPARSSVAACAAESTYSRGSAGVAPGSSPTCQAPIPELPSVKSITQDTRTPAGWRSALRRLHERRSLILCYHGVAPSKADEDPEFLRVDPDRF